VGYNQIKLKPIGIPQNLMDDFQAGFVAWNNPSCNPSGNSFPLFSTNCAGSGRVIEMRYQLGSNPESPARCGDFVGNTVTLYEKATINGRVFFCSRDDVFRDSVSHEVGHTIGMEDSTCNGYIMRDAAITTQGDYIDRHVRAEECQVADDTNYTPDEQQADQCAANPASCPATPPDRCRRPFGARGQDAGDCPSSPVVVDLDHAGFEFTGLDHAVSFDIDADGLPEQLAWTNGKSSDLFLCWDRNGNGVIDNGGELFGDNTRFLDGTLAENGYQVLFELDVEHGNSNGFIEAQDAIYDQLCLWDDRNRNGVSEAQELSTLREEGVTALAVAYRVSLQRDDHGNHLRLLSTAHLRDKSGETTTTDTVDVFFVVASPVLSPP
jgi:hypothetical protein